MMLGTIYYSTVHTQSECFSYLDSDMASNRSSDSSDFSSVWHYAISGSVVIYSTYMSGDLIRLPMFFK